MEGNLHRDFLLLSFAYASLGCLSFLVQYTTRFSSRLLLVHNAYIIPARLLRTLSSHLHLPTKASSSNTTLRSRAYFPFHGATGRWSEGASESEPFLTGSQAESSDSEQYKGPACQAEPNTACRSSSRLLPSLLHARPPPPSSPA